MANTNLSALRDDVLDLANVLYALGPGSGSNRMLEIIRHEPSIELLGFEVHAEMEFPSAANRNDLIAQATEYLEENAKERYSTRGDVIIDEIIYPGDTVLLSSAVDRIFGKIQVKEVIETVDASGRSITRLDTGLSVQDFIDRAVEETKDPEEERDITLGLGAPEYFRIKPISSGLSVAYAQPVNSLAVGVEAHVATQANVEASRDTIVDLGSGNPSAIPLALTRDTRYWVKIRFYSKNKKEFSDWTNELDELAGGAEIGAIAFDDIGGKIDQSMLDATLSETVDNARIDHDVITANADAWDEAVSQSLANETAINRIGSTVTTPFATTAVLKINANNTTDAEGTANGKVAIGSSSNGTSTITVDGATVYSFPKATLDPRVVAGTDLYIIADIQRLVYTTVYFFEGAWFISNFNDPNNLLTINPDPTKHLFIGKIEPASSTLITAAYFFEEVITTLEYSQTFQSATEYQTIVVKLSGNGEGNYQYSAITQLSNEIDLRVRQDDIVRSINLSPEALRINHEKVLIGNLNNMVGNPTFATPDSDPTIEGWLGISAAYAKNTNGVPSNAPSQFVGRTNLTSVRPEDFHDTGKAEWYYFAVDVYLASGSGQLTLRAETKRDASSTLYFYNIQTVTLNQTWQTLQGRVQLNSADTKVRLGISISASAQAFITNVVMRRALTAELFVDGQVLARAVKVDDKILIASPSQTQGALSVEASGLGEVLRLGAIAGYSSVPAGVGYGLWGKLGTGVFIEGAIRMVKAGIYSLEQAIPATGSPAQFTWSSSADLITGAFTVPSGKKWYIVFQPFRLGTSDDAVMLSGSFINCSVVSGLPIFSNTVGAGSYNTLRASLSLYARSVASVDGSTSFVYNAMYQIIEVDSSLTV